jgi:hypothetical protein
MRRWSRPWKILAPRRQATRHASSASFLCQGCRRCGHNASIVDEHNAKSVLNIVAAQLASQRAQLGISLDEAAARSNIDTERLDLAENAEVALDESELQRLADAYGIGITAFFGGRVTPIQYLFGT